jgi:cysteine desulfurase family protein (TIGR01976 family)
MQYIIDMIRSQFPALRKKQIFFDGPGGTQVPRQTIRRMREYLLNSNANSGGAFSTSQQSDEIVQTARLAMVDFFNASRPEEIVFGANMTTLTFNLSHSLAQQFNPGDEIIVTRLDHDANISPWLHLARERGCQVHWLDFNPDDCTLNLDQYGAMLNERTRLVAIGYASNAVGTINPVADMIAQAHRVGAYCFIDAVHFAPHDLIDVRNLDCDFLVVSAYKFFGPHIGVLYGKYGHMERLPAYKVRPASPLPPGKYETGTGNFEGIAGLLGTMEYLTGLGEHFASHANPSLTKEQLPGRILLQKTMQAIRTYEIDLAHMLIDVLSAVPGLRIWGITQAERLNQRVPTVSFTLRGHHPRQVAEHLARYGIHVWDGNFYALAVTERLGLEAKGGMVRIGPVHYNTPQEIEHLSNTLSKLP